MQALTAAILAALASRATLASSEGGDTWSAIDAIRPSRPSLSQSPDGVGFKPAAPACAREGSEGGDTWPEVASAPATNSADLTVVATTGGLSALQDDPPGELPNVYGTPLNETAVDLIVRIGSESRWINVDYGESVRFITTDGNGAERSFSWRFDVSPEVNCVGLSTVAPPDVLVYGVRIFISPNPLYRGGG